MYHNQIFIAPNYTLDECKELFFRLRITSKKAEWDKAIEIFCDRMNSRFFNAIRILLDQCRVEGHEWEQNLSFSLMALNCLLIETLQQFYEGNEFTPPRDNRWAFRRFFKHSDHLNFSPQIADHFYRSIRCGILHQAETKGKVALSFSDYGQMVETRGNEWLVFNVNLITDGLLREFETYVHKLSQRNETDLRQNFIRKMYFIIAKADQENDLISNQITGYN